MHEVQNPHLYGPNGLLDAAPAVQNPLLQEQAQQQQPQPLPRPNFTLPNLTQQQEQAAVQDLEVFSTPAAHVRNNSPPKQAMQTGWLPQLPYIPTPERSIDFSDLPKDAKIFNQANRSLTYLDGAYLLVDNFPKDGPNSSHLVPTYEESAYGAKLKTKPVKPAKQPYTKRTSSRETKPIDRYQPGLNAAEVYEAQLNAIAASRGFVDQQGRYRSFSSERRNQAYPSAGQSNDNSRFPSGNGLRKMSQNRDSSRNRPDSRDAKTRTPSNGYRNSSRGNQNNFQRSQSKSPSRNGAPLMNSANRQSRADSRAEFRSANRSTSARRNYPQMKKGINCSPDYNPYTMKKCTKCLKPGHHEFECARYFSYNARLCYHCNKMNHADNDCQEAKAFPPNTNQKN
jgi:hypothetical protein